MKLRNILLVAASLCITWGGAYAQKKKTFYVPKAGTLVELLTENEANQITHLTLQANSTPSTSAICETNSPTSKCWTYRMPP